MVPGGSCQSNRARQFFRASPSSRTAQLPGKVNLAGLYNLAGYQPVRSASPGIDAFVPPGVF